MTNSNLNIQGDESLQKTFPKEMLKSWLENRLETAEKNWLNERLRGIEEGDQRELYLSFGQASRRIKRRAVELSNSENLVLAKTNMRWHPQHWTVDQLVRSVMVLSFPHDDKSLYLRVIDRLFATGEVQELVTLYQMLSIFPHVEMFVSRCTEGIRTCMQVVFQSVAHYNAYPADYLDEMSYNQMVLKSLFSGIPIYKIVGLEARSNPLLSRMLSDYARERWAAKRSISPELWRVVGRYADERGVECLHRLSQSENPMERLASQMALQDAGLRPHHLPRVEITWDQLGEACEQGQTLTES